MKVSTGLLCAAFGVSAANAAALRSSRDVQSVCAAQSTNHGCSAFCGFEGTLAGEEYLCLPSASLKRPAFPFTITEEDRAEYCEMVAARHGCDDICGFKWDNNAGECRDADSVTNDLHTSDPQRPRKAVGNDNPIIGGSGKFRYQYMPDLLQAPAGASLVNCHGLVTDQDNNIYLTYQNDGKTDENCLIRWNPDGTGGEFMTGGGTTLCSGTPHGLKIVTEGPNRDQFLYHANNDQKLTKTTLNGDVIWQVDGLFGQDTNVYRPTWFATPPDSEYMYLCDGYGSNQVYAFDKNGTFMNETWGGKSPQAGPDAPHGTFSTNHGCTYDPRIPDEHMIVVSDRANSRFEFFNYDPEGFSTFEWNRTVNFEAMMGPGTLPCNMRMYPKQEGRAIVPDLAGPVAVLDETNTVISVVNVSVLLAEQQHK
eukprot:INCI13083.2.p1 GENE.INCI13083.2~~INCI13083.2.p1  ORF type:complete len:484 (+),score=60.15 INCI13083.2:184-1452(+)